MTSILDEAKAILEAEEGARNRNSRNEKREKYLLTSKIKNRFAAYLPKMPVIFEVIRSNFRWEGEPDSLARNYVFFKGSEPTFFAMDLGSVNFDLMQEKQLVHEFGEKNAVSSLCAWAVAYYGIYGYTVYFVPYRNTEEGFACTVFGTEGNKYFFKHDVDRDFAVKWVKEYLEYRTR